MYFILFSVRIFLHVETTFDYFEIKINLNIEIAFRLFYLKCFVAAEYFQGEKIDIKN